VHPCPSRLAAPPDSAHGAEPQHRAFGCIPEKNRARCEREATELWLLRPGTWLSPAAAGPGGAFPSSVLAVARIREPGLALARVPGDGQSWGALVLYRCKGGKRGRTSQIADWIF